LAFSPLINKGDGVAYALAFEAVARSYPAYVSNFVEASILGVQDRGMGPSNWKAIERFGQAARLPVSLPILVSANQAQARAAVNAAIDRQRLLGVTNTPAVAVAGTYVATPEFTSGDATMFSELVNGLISMAS
jgi:thiol:disulfide interchange protein DsbA